MSGQPGDDEFLLREGVEIFREWECALDYNGGSAALNPDIERLVTRLLGMRREPCQGGPSQT